MSNNVDYIFKIATELTEFQQIFDLNYTSFVEEIPQHKANKEHFLKDKFHDKNTYLICLTNEGELAGMLSIADERPFSLDGKIDNLDDYIGGNEKSCEIRLLAVKKPFRNTFVFHGLANALEIYCSEKGYDIAFISGTTRQLKLYKHLGFIPFGNLTGKDGAMFQPMYKRAVKVNE
ncbi:MAG: GNAT family N-acetyltransferase [Eubacteriales bacterium]